jgi:hypothetical protein
MATGTQNAKQSELEREPRLGLMPRQCCRNVAASDRRKDNFAANALKSRKTGP